MGKYTDLTTDYWKKKWNSYAAQNTDEQIINKGSVNPFFSIEKEQLVNFIGDISGKSILELACGTGWMARELKGFSSYLGLDIAEEMVNIARQKNTNKRVEFINIDLNQLNSLSLANRFDIVLFLGSSQYFQPEDLSILLSTVYKKIINPNGLFIIQFRNNYALHRLIKIRSFIPYSIMDHIKIFFKKHPSLYRFYSLKQMKKYLKHSGFAPIELMGFDIEIPFFPEDSSITRMVNDKLFQLNKRKLLNSKLLLGLASNIFIKCVPSYKDGLRCL